MSYQDRHSAAVDCSGRGCRCGAWTDRRMFCPLYHHRNRISYHASMDAVSAACCRSRHRSHVQIRSFPIWNKQSTGRHFWWEICPSAYGSTHHGLHRADSCVWGFCRKRGCCPAAGRQHWRYPWQVAQNG